MKNNIDTKLQTIEWIILVTDKYSQSRAFYKNLLKLTPIREVIEEKFSQFKLKNCFLAIYGRKQYEKLVSTPYILTLRKKEYNLFLSPKLNLGVKELLILLILTVISGKYSNG